MPKDVKTKPRNTLGRKTIEHIVVPDAQVTPDTSTEHLRHAGEYIATHQPDVLVCIGDFADMHSLSSYDRGKKGFEGRRYSDDVKAAKRAMSVLLAPMQELQKRQRKNKQRVYKPRMIMTLGNHENRINRAVSNDAILDGTISTDDLGYKEAGWEVYDFLEAIEVDGVTYSHFFPRSGNGRVLQSTRGAPTARTQGQREMRSCTSGHLQGLDFDVHQLGNRRIYNIIAGSCYTHEEDYLTPQGTQYWRGIIHKFDVGEGMYDPLFVSLDYLKRRYGK
jgi:hypothetical protein